MSQDVRRDEEQATLRRSRILGMTYVDTSALSTKPLYKELLTIPELYSMRVIPLRADDHNIQFGVTNTTSQATMSNLRQRFLDQQIGFALISDAGFREYMKRYDPPKQVVYQNISLAQAGDQALQQEVSATLRQVKADDVLAYLVQQASRLKASDIHLETEANGARVRFRIDGVLHPIAVIDSGKYKALIAAIASAGNVSTAATDAQQGHITQQTHLADRTPIQLNLRLETMPTVNGMDVVMRLFNMEQSMYNLDHLGLSPEERHIVDQMIHQPSGLVLIVGPTGSGKTTTLYSMLNSLNSQERKIVTIEDPVEYQFSGMTQVSVTTATSGQTSFADKLRGVLRLDPDVVMIGEIRDLDTAKTALQASLTGHLVLSSFHAGSAAAALTRLMDVIEENPLFVAAIRLIMAQRLVRRLDDATKEAYQPDEPTLAKIKAVIDGLPSTSNKPSLDNLQLYKPGKSADNPYGFSGQLAIREQLLMTKTIYEAMQQAGRRLSTVELEQAAIADGMQTLLQDGMLKVIQGLTTLDELYRVAG